MASAQSGNTVRVHYTGRLEDQTVFDSSTDREPLEFTLGENQVIGGFEKAVEGMQIGDKKNVQIDSQDAYGPHLDELVMSVGKEQFPPEITPEVGKNVNVQDNQGSQYTMKITDTNDSSVTLDANHPLAGKNLNFTIELVEIL
ncbi:peptidylprolyl isomerase [Chitinispirillales bacterium ANBcel5]|uniref:FKBP-type peptidyl-prolyl cis-trans isomerase n=1 Tax=Cellulosispirillum alkaliphilum TaxID=3039283 RepID=UPI002A5360EF|nr:peptidylprolyl isomerase [Chitinispirillales bacterium ANBcel5]